MLFSHNANNFFNFSLCEKEEQNGGYLELKIKTVTAVGTSAERKNTQFDETSERTVNLYVQQQFIQKSEISV